MKNIILSLIIILLMFACTNSPMDRGFRETFTPNQNETMISGTDLEVLVKDSAKDSMVIIDKEKDYILVPVGKTTQIHDNPWCYQSNDPSGAFTPDGWDCKNYSLSTLDDFDGYSVGIAYNDTHMVNVLVDTDKKVYLYEPQLCEWSTMNPKLIIIK